MMFVLRKSYSSFHAVKFWTTSFLFPGVLRNEISVQKGKIKQKKFAGMGGKGEEQLQLGRRKY
jgi:hypothetical protein